MLEPKDTIHLVPHRQEYLSQKSMLKRSWTVNLEEDSVGAVPAGLAKSQHPWGPVSSGVKCTVTFFS